MIKRAKILEDKGNIKYNESLSNNIIILRIYKAKEAEVVFVKNESF
jgi:hypothetical protein